MSGAASERGRACLNALEEAGRRAGWEVEREYPVPGGRVDLVWLWRPDSALPGVTATLPMVGFEIESSSRSRKHVKGDMVNLIALQASLGVIVLLGLGDDDGLRRHTESLVQGWRVRIAVWTEREVEALREGKAPPPATTLKTWTPLTTKGGAMQPTDTHWGKYQPLWAWLRSRPDDRVELTFTQIEGILGFPLPPSSRKHQPHWHSYEGSAVVRAIRDAGWKARDVNIPTETVILERQV